MPQPEYIARRMPRPGASRSVRVVFRRLYPYQLAVDVTGAVLFALVAVPLEVALGQGTTLNIPISVLLAVVFGTALALRRASPALALGIAWFGAIVQMSFGRTPGFVDLVVFAVLYTAAAYGSRLLFWLGFSSAVGGAIVATVYLYIVLNSNDITWQTLTVAAAVMIAATFALLLAWTVGALVRTARRARAGRLAQEQAEAETAAEQERARIARDMHDVVAHSLAVVIAQADGARYAGASDPGAQTAALGTISTTARAALADVRVLLAQLRHRQEEGPQPTVADLEALFGHVRAAGVDLRVTIDPAPQAEAPAAVQLAVYRILQEATTNALRHGGAGPVEVFLAWHPDHVRLEVRNALRVGSGGAAASGDRAGADASVPLDPPRGHGLIGMRERALLVGGTLEAEAADGVFVVRATLPMGGIR
jgi:signal transduction histidine kinase